MNLRNKFKNLKEGKEYSPLINLWENILEFYIQQKNCQKQCPYKKEFTVEKHIQKMIESYFWMEFGTKFPDLDDVTMRQLKQECLNYSSGENKNPLNDSILERLDKYLYVLVGTYYFFNKNGLNLLLETYPFTEDENHDFFSKKYDQNFVVMAIFYLFLTAAKSKNKVPEFKFNKFSKELRTELNLLFKNKNFIEKISKNIFAEYLNFLETFETGSPENKIIEYFKKFACLIFRRIVVNSLSENGNIQDDKYTPISNMVDEFNETETEDKKLLLILSSIHHKYADDDYLPIEMNDLFGFQERKTK